jgi:hypothetical protein
LTSTAPADRVARRRLAAASLALAAGVLVAGCGVLGASEITVTARNDSDDEMVVQVMNGLSDDGGRHGDSHTVAPGGEEQLTLAVPGGDWTVTVNGARLLSTSDAGERRGELPVTLILPNPEDFALGPYWEAPTDWAQTAP